MLLIISSYQWGPCCSSVLSVGSMLLIISGYHVHVAHHLRLSVGSMLLIISGYQWGPCCSSSPVISGVHVTFRLHSATLAPSYTVHVGGYIVAHSATLVHVAHHHRLSVGSMLLIISGYQWGPCCSSLLHSATLVPSFKISWRLHCYIVLH